MKVVLIGSGNVAHHLGLALKNAKIDILQVFGRNLSKVRVLSKMLECRYTQNLQNISVDGDIYIIAVSDDAISDVSDQLSSLPDEKIIVHTSGGTSSDVLSINFSNFGVLYPLQTFSKEKELDFAKVPLCLSASNENVLTILEKLASKLSNRVYRISDKERKILHIAAVFANNFSNHMFAVSELVCKSNNLDFEILKPLINETVNKLEKGSPSEMQTGPAKRGDRQTMNTHLDLLSKNPELAKIYQLLSESILKFYKR